MRPDRVLTPEEELSNLSKGIRAALMAVPVCKGLPIEFGKLLAARSEAHLPSAATNL